jgi:hypothetical protein
MFSLLLNEVLDFLLSSHTLDLLFDHEAHEERKWDGENIVWMEKRVQDMMSKYTGSVT